MPVEFKNSRLSALGGYHAALTDDVTTILNNPAGFSAVKPELLISELTLGLAGPIFDITGVLIEGNFDINDPIFLAKLAPILKQTAGMELVGPVAFAYTGNGIAFGLFNWADLSYGYKGGVNLETIMTDNLLLTGGYSFRIPIAATNLDIGLQLKALLRGIADSRIDASDIINTILSLDRALTISIGGGVDLGILYSIEDIFSAGIVARNLYTPTIRNNYVSINEFLAGAAAVQEQGIVPLDLSGGIKFAPPLGFLDWIISDFKILLDYGDILDFILHPATAKQWFLHLGLGIEFKMLEKLSLRGGFNQGLFSAGIGLDLTIFSISASMFGSEGSLFTGLQPIYNMVIGLEFKI